jgi:tape measure domain-containing protein
MIIENLKAIFTLDSSSFNAGMEKVGRSLKNTSNSFKKATSVGLGFGRSLSSVAAQAGKISAVIGGIGAAAGGANIKLASMVAEVGSLKRGLQFATADINGNSDAFQFLSEESDRLGISLATSIESFKGMAAAARDSSLEGEGVKEIYLAIAEASSVLGLSSERTKLSMNAVQQMMSKGKITSEELRQQLGESLPMAMNTMAKSLGVTTAELSKMMEQGGLLASDVLPKFAQQLREDVAGALEESTQSVQASLGRLGTAWFRLKDEFLAAEFSDELKASIDWMTGVLDGLPAKWQNIKRSIARVSAEIRYLFAVLQAGFEAMMPFFKTLISMFSQVGKAIVDGMLLPFKAVIKTFDVLSSKASKFFGFFAKGSRDVNKVGNLFGGMNLPTKKVEELNSALSDTAKETKAIANEAEDVSSWFASITPNVKWPKREDFVPDEDKEIMKAPVLEAIDSQGAEAISQEIKIDMPEIEPIRADQKMKIDMPEIEPIRAEMKVEPPNVSDLASELDIKLEDLEQKVSLKLDETSIKIPIGVEAEDGNVSNLIKRQADLLQAEATAAAANFKTKFKGLDFELEYELKEASIQGERELAEQEVKKSLDNRLVSLKDYYDAQLQTIDEGSQKALEITKVYLDLQEKANLSSEAQLTKIRVDAEKVRQQQVSKVFEENFSTSLSVLRGSISKTTNLFVSMATEGKGSFKELGMSVVKDIQKMVYELFVIEPLMKQFSAFMKGGTPSGTGAESFLGRLLTGNVGGSPSPTGTGQESSQGGVDLQTGEITNVFRTGVDGILASFLGTMKGSFGGLGAGISTLVTSVMGSLKGAMGSVGSVLSSIMGSFGNSGGGFLSSMLGMATSFLGFADGGIISEPVVGLGLRTGTGYTIGEKGAEAVVPLGGPNKQGKIAQPKQGDTKKAETKNIVNVSISALDSKSVVDLMQRNPQAITSPIIQALQMGDRSLSAAMRGAL